MEAKCNCEAIQVKIDDPELFSQPRSYICHCSNCRKTSGSLFSSNLLIDSSKVTITGEDNLSRYEDMRTLSGNAVSRYFCKTCGSPIKSEAGYLPGKTIVKLGIFERVPSPLWEAFVLKRQEWIAPQEGCVQYKMKSFGEKVGE